MLINKLKFEIKALFFSIFELLTCKKPLNLKIQDFIFIIFLKTRYQSIQFKDGTLIKKKCDKNIIDSTIKIKKLKIKNYYESYLDIGCSEGFFLIEAFKKKCNDITGIDIQDSRLKVAKILIKNWSCAENIRLIKKDIRNFKISRKFDTVTCLSVGHHFHGNRNHDTWKIIGNINLYNKEYKNLINFFKKLSNLTNKKAYIEYCYEFEEKVRDFSPKKLQEIIRKLKIFKSFNFYCYTQYTEKKIRAIYLGKN